MLERNVVAYLKSRVKALGGQARKVHWEGRAGAPDWLVWFPTGINAFIETKATGQKPKAHQEKEHESMRQGGLLVFVCDSPESIDEALKSLLGDIA